MFKPDRFYLTDDAELTSLFSPKTLAHWRHQRTGPAYSRVGKRIVYKGQDLLDWLATNRVDPTSTATAA